MSPILEFRLPDIGEGLTEAEIVRWLVDVGDHVHVDQPVVEVETAKATVELPCPHDGTVTCRMGEEGEVVAVGSILVTVAATSEQSQEDAGKVLVGSGVHTAPARRRRRVRSGSVPSRRATTPVARQAPSPRTDAATPVGAPVAVVSPLVRRLARENGVDLRTVQGTGAAGLVLRADVQRAITATRGAHAAGRAESERIPIRSVRKAIADKLSRSRREIPDVTCWVDTDATGLLAAREALGSGPERTSLLALLARMCVAAALRFPELNSMVDTDRQEIIRFSDVNLGFAVQTGKGLLVPVVHGAHRMSTSELSGEIARLTESARTGTLSPSELTGATITLNNYGRYGIDGATPIINHPETAMLGVGRIVAKPWVHGGELAVRQVVQLTLTFDHRVCDGETASGFLRHVADRVEQPLKLISFP
ncbi:pyruvate dehydrogenase E2 component (dihydrolipoamide acetyltransferase) [Saccharopolyspora erythraea NRRL 2338]|uniref:Dihydrolipoamide acetyltransferase component of pyruvate dehydrogenase complex n=2 Tax=Saccharopolyspora erythraea TaxID=1836 RepID=A4FL05_SACEN|nr:dihydrolipoamide acetyltransferase family protein [Saccharopolyspora erythraea]EQD84138.1 branched-chain alpha-keto acid dehydrogenase subunit E2 [Saccharopolyspora erythraea D]PFG98369.1 pyruvate dehydrogenase E2 component (dihydrolipoamide acetyltransferase) [Saccharopolyspora erythraea NRRL 2338]QRK88439.1 2-oxo acid dehydrogenase subunit E2 [Saccharopolyspora erythraea]CAM04730.1 putative dihydrolipoamide acyltransferase component E2 [Saccharopolyspora erythraea NRRL 2338]